MADKQNETRHLRVREPGAHTVYVQALGEYVTPDPTRTYTLDDPVVQEHGWLFDEVGSLAVPEERVTSVRLPETTRQRPGAGRTRGAGR
jgi:hypothetical protein